MTLIQQILIGLVFLGLLVFVHELGHFIVAKWRKVRVNAFSIGFGKVLLKKKIGETEYRVSLLPFGGYVAMEGEDPSRAKGEDYEFSSKKPWERIAIAFAGPFFNILFGLFVLIIAYSFVGVSDFPDDGAYIGYVADSSLSKKIGAGDKILKINNVEIKGWTRLSEEIALTKDSILYLSVQKSSGQILDSLSIKTHKVFDKTLHVEYPTIDIFPPIMVKIHSVKDSFPAKKAGIKTNDVIELVNGKKVYSVLSFINYLKDVKKGDSVSITVHRGDSLLNFELIPDYSSNRPLIGVMLSSEVVKKLKYSIPGAIKHSFIKSWDITKMTFRAIKHLVVGDLSINAMSGPVGIVQATGAIAKSDITDIFFFLALISINLALFNLLPLIITDGGLILFFIIEILRGKPLPLNIQILLQNIAMAFFIGFAIFISFFDIKRIAKTDGGQDNKTTEVVVDSLKDSTRVDTLKNDSILKVISNDSTNLIKKDSINK